MANDSLPTYRRNLPPEEILYEVKRRYRISHYISLVSLIWLFCLAIFNVLRLVIHDSDSRMIANCFSVVQIALVFLWFAVWRAVYRCPVCDKHLGRRHPGKEQHCKCCNALVIQS